MLTRTDLREMRAITQRILKGSVSREDWSNFAALTLIWQGDPVTTAIAAQGLDEFIRVSQPIYEGHAFRHDDYKRMYDRVCWAASRYHQDRVQ